MHVSISAAMWARVIKTSVNIKTFVGIVCLALLHWLLFGETSKLYVPKSEKLNCQDRPLESSVRLQGSYWIFYNYVQAEKGFRCLKSVTFTTQGDYKYLDNIVPLVERWKGPMSVALYAPGDDFKSTLESIAYLRNCEGFAVRQFVSFSLFFPLKHYPRHISVPLINAYEDSYNCSKGPPYENETESYQIAHKLVYPINVARNVARKASQTHFVLPSDIELYPSVDIIPKFLNFVSNNEPLIENGRPKLFVLPVFEVTRGLAVPENKTRLVEMYRSKRVSIVHANICLPCHNIPKAKEWLELSETSDLKVFATVKRQKEYWTWEAFYIATNEEPYFDERLTWEGRSDKMTQAYSLCLLDYDYMVMDNIFLIHRPKSPTKQVRQLRADLTANTNYLIDSKIRPELDAIYGARKGCIVHY